MTKQQAIQRKSEIEKELPELDKIINAPDITPEERFWQIMNGCVIYEEKENTNSVFYMKEGKVFFELECSILWCRYDSVWSVFESEYSMSYNNIQSFIKNQVENRFKMQGVTPAMGVDTTTAVVENRFKMRGVTPKKY